MDYQRQFDFIPTNCNAYPLLDRMYIFITAVYTARSTFTTAFARTEYCARARARVRVRARENRGRAHPIGGNKYLLIINEAITRLGLCRVIPNFH
jgi:hypothetical protein